MNDKQTKKMKNKQKKKYKKLPNCPICLTKIGKKTMKKTKCNHKYHHYCLDKWLENNDKCPMCRTILIEREIFFFSLISMRLNWNFLMNPKFWIYFFIFFYIFTIGLVFVL